LTDQQIPGLRLLRVGDGGTGDEGRPEQQRSGTVPNVFHLQTSW
jgi:hypothetical protein